MEDRFPDQLVDDDSLGFLDEFDNVRPHSLKVLMYWIDASLAGRNNICTNSYST